MAHHFANAKVRGKKEEGIGKKLIHYYLLLITSTYGGLAQLGERLPCKQEVSGSIPLISTKEID